VAAQGVRLNELLNEDRATAPCATRPAESTRNAVATVAVLNRQQDFLRALLWCGESDSLATNGRRVGVFIDLIRGDYMHSQKMPERTYYHLRREMLRRFNVSPMRPASREDIAVEMTANESRKALAERIKQDPSNEFIHDDLQ
jgi:hypothetical protein